MAKEEKVASIVLNWNRASDTIDAIASLKRARYSNHEIILVDNGSTDDSLAQIQNAFPDLEVVRNEANLGFAEGNNRGISHAISRGADFIFLLNNDATVHPEIFTAFLAAATERPDAGVFGAKIYYHDEPTTIWYAGGGVNPKTQRCFHHGCPESDLEKKWEELRETEYACGCALFIRAHAVQAVGMMDPRFFLLWEEIDWCRRLQKAGHRVLFVPEAKVWHKISTSFEGGNRGPLWQYYYFRNRLLFLEKHEPLKNYLSIISKELFSLLKDFRNPLSRAALRGILDYSLRRFGEKTGHGQSLGPGHEKKER